jgi:molybdopterin/thiamine biosynthesis adenylyltransferase
MLDAVSAPFDYSLAFSRNLGWFTPQEQARLRDKRVAIAGLGGVGGAHLVTLARLGIGRFSLAEFDQFELPNFNRQAGATMSNLGRSKLESMVGIARDINPELDLRTFDDGVQAHNVDAFLEGVDIFVDGLDFFAFSARELVFPACRARAIPATTVAPLGMGAALLNFLPTGMSFEDYFGFGSCSDTEKAIRFLIGLAPAMLHRGYLADIAYVDLQSGRGPSTPMACQLCAGIAATEAAKILLGRGPVTSAPRGLQFDAYRNRLTTTWRPGGYRNPLQAALRSVARRQLARGGRR